MLPLFGNAQYLWEFGAKAGVSNYLGEMGGMQETQQEWLLDMKMEQTRWAFGAYARYKILDKVSAQTELNYIRIEGADTLSTNPGRHGRNLHFRNDMIVLNVRAEYIFYKVHDVGRTGRYILDFNAYAFLGVGFLYGAPAAQAFADGDGFTKGTYYSLPELKTEGQTNAYAPIAFTMPVGAGFYYTIKKQHRIGFEFGWTFVTSDYLDDVSTSYADETNMSDIQKHFANRYGQAGSGTNTSIAAPAVNYGYSEQAGASPRGSKGGTPDENGNTTSTSSDNIFGNDNYVTAQLSYGFLLKGKYRNRKFQTTRRGIHGLGNYKRRKRKTRAKF